ncbi:MAG: hydantoinase/oxoprolinase family protein [Planctomycetia bacterium]
MRDRHEQQAERRVKVGIDVGGTFTHAVALEARTHELLGKVLVPTTHEAREGVARGVVDSLLLLLKETGIAPSEVVLVAHGTTQATNALLEGDVAPVGIVAMARGATKARARREMELGEVEIADGVHLSTRTRFLDLDAGLSDAQIDAAIDGLVAEGAQVVVASQSFGIEDPANELRVVERARARGLCATAGSELSQIFGLRTRTRTAAINACMLPKMLETANMTERAVKESGVGAPLMVVRSDGGIMDLATMRTRPILTMLSGPAAGVAAAILHAKVSDGIFVEVGGTSSDICLVRRGRPLLAQARIGGARLFVRTIDVRTVGVAGGSLVRAAGRRITAVGPRSAHIAGLAYEAFSPADPGRELVRIAPRKGDRDDHVALRTRGAARADVAPTPTGAANLLGYAKARSRGDHAACEAAWTIFGKELGLSALDAAKAVLDAAIERVLPVVKELVAGAKGERLTLVGGGGGAEAIVPHLARKARLEHQIAPDAEVISAIGAAIGVVQDVVERSMSDPGESELDALRRAAFESVARMGADPKTIEVLVEVDPRARLARATARGASSMDGAKRAIDDDERRSLCAKALAVAPEDVHLAGEGWLRVGHALRRERWLGILPVEREPACVVDGEGLVRAQMPDARRELVDVARLDATLRLVGEQLSSYGDAGELPPDVLLVLPTKLVDLGSLATVEQMCALARLETRGLPGGLGVALLARRRE